MGRKKELVVLILMTGQPIILDNSSKKSINLIEGGIFAPPIAGVKFA